ncbi:hypothetical protein Nepgr_010267 [Nepenthes gracilis]|uniref:Uncharacterized protein n=1 Tax=Nepenthes gracilis TaxID=150966 RepID=A0AAD3XKW9_NEPGR|nr:hypothetical protein Nepgr_010267 [Nepenthes gracilis]
MLLHLFSIQFSDLNARKRMIISLTLVANGVMEYREDLLSCVCGNVVLRLPRCGSDHKFLVYMFAEAKGLMICLTICCDCLKNALPERFHFPPCMLAGRNIIC